jgi:hypothetical protein
MQAFEPYMTPETFQQFMVSIPEVYQIRRVSLRFPSAEWNWNGLGHQVCKDRLQASGNLS